jgi:hypothetical protein
VRSAVRPIDVLMAVGLNPAAFLSGGFAYDIARDGKRIIAIVEPDSGSSIVVLENWRAMLNPGSVVS